MSSKGKGHSKNVYHYTSAEGLQRILSTGRIEASKDNKRDATFGADKVYLTGLSPEKHTASEIAHNNWDDSPKFALLNLPKVEYAVELNSREIGTSQEKTRRDIYTHEGDLPVSNNIQAVYKRETDGNYQKILE